MCHVLNISVLKLLMTVISMQVVYRMKCLLLSLKLCMKPAKKKYLIFYGNKTPLKTKIYELDQETCAIHFCLQSAVTVC